MRDGFLIVPDLFSKREVRAYKVGIAQVLDEVQREILSAAGDPEAALRSGVYVGLSVRSELCQILREDPRILDVLEVILSPSIEFLSDKVVFKSEKTDFSTPWHQDWHYWHGTHKISVWLALDDATPENGCMKLLPGSHLAPVVHDGDASDGLGFGHRLRPDVVDESKAIAAAVPAGGAVFFHDLALHASYPNNSGHDRWAWIGTYRDALTPDMEYDWAVARKLVRGGV